MNGLVEFLTAAIAEDEAVARAADSGRWVPEDKGITFEWSADDWHDEETQARLQADTRANQNHIAEWSPARVLAECEAKRRIVAEWQGAQAEAAAGDASGRIAVFALSLAMMAIAIPYADRPGFREEWRA